MLKRVFVFTKFEYVGRCKVLPQSSLQNIVKVKNTRCYAKMNAGQERSLIEYSKKSLTPIRFQSLCNMLTGSKAENESRLKLAALFAKKELPIRFAKLIGDLESLPYGLSKTKSISKMRMLYTKSFNDIALYPNAEIEKDYISFVELLRTILITHRYTVPMAAMGLLEMRRSNPILMDLSTSCPFLGQFLNKFFQSRITIRLLMAHLVCCLEDKKGSTGEIHHNCDFDKIFSATAEDVTKLCHHNYGRAPAIEVRNRLKKQFTYLPGHIHVILFELLKNSYRAVCEFHENSKDIPPIRVIVVGGERVVAIKIQDEGGGIAVEEIDKIWLYTYSSACIAEETWDDKELVNALKHSLVWYKLPSRLEATKGGVNCMPIEDEGEMNVDFMGGVVDVPMAGFGYGLPIARVYASFFGGSLDLKSAQGHGTDTYIHLPFINPNIILPM